MSAPPMNNADEMIRLSRGQYALVDGVVYEQVGYSATNDRMWVLRAVLPNTEPARREVAAGSPTVRWISSSATYRGARLTDLIFMADGQMSFSTWPYPREWPADIPLRRYGTPERAGDGFWTGTISFAELTEFDDGIPDDWRPYLPDGTAQFRDEPRTAL